MRARFIGLLAILCGGNCAPSEDAIRAEIASANTCVAASDCGDVGSYCPYGCAILVNQSQVDRIRALVEANNDNTCAYDCAVLTSITCDSGVCVGQFQ